MTILNQPKVTADLVLDAIRAHHHQAAIVAEVALHDPDADDHYEQWLDKVAAGEGNTPRPPATRRIDALMFRTLERTAIEIKVDTADVRREDHRKVAPWRRVTHRFVYAVPAGLIDQPPMWGTGLWWIHDDGRVEVVRRAKVNTTPEPLPQHVIQALAYRAARTT